MTSKQETECLTPEQFVAAHAKWGDDFVVVDFENGKEAKNKMAKYYKTKVRLENGELKNAYLKYTLTKINGCKSPEDRAKNKNVGPGFSIYGKSVGKNNSPVGLACSLFASAWQKNMYAVRGKNGMPDDKVNLIMQSTRKDASGKNVPLEDPIIRFKFRENKTDGKPDGTFSRDIVVIKNGKQQTCADDGKPFNVSNIHEYVRGGSLAMGTIDFSDTTTSQQGYSNSACNGGMYIRPSSAVGPNLQNEFNQDDLADLMGSCEMDEDSPSNVVYKATFDASRSNKSNNTTANTTTNAPVKSLEEFANDD